MNPYIDSVYVYLSILKKVMYIYVYLFEKHKLNIASNISVKAWKGLGVACTSQGIHPCD